MAHLLAKKDIDKRLSKLDGWSVNRNETQVSKTFKTTDFISGLMFVARISVRAEILNHHPDVELSYGCVKIKLTTHDVKGLTKNDFMLAEQISDIYNRNY